MRKKLGIVLALCFLLCGCTKESGNEPQVGSPDSSLLQVQNEASECENKYETLDIGNAEIIIPERKNETAPSLPEKLSYGFVAAKPFGPRQSVLRHVNPSLNQHPYADILRHAPPSGMYAKLQKRDRPAKRHTLLPNGLPVSGSRPYYACFAFLSAGACSGLRGRALRPGFTSCAFRNSAALPLPFTTTGESSWPLFILPM